MIRRSLIFPGIVYSSREATGTEILANATSACKADDQQE